MNPLQTRVDDLKASQIVARYPADAATVQRASEIDEAFALLKCLISDDEFHSAIDFLCHWMPPQHLVWWGCLCVWEIERNLKSEPIETAVQLIVRWLQTPQERQRHALRQIDDLVPPDHPLNFLGKAALYSHGSMAGPDLPPVEAPQYLYCRMGGSSIKLVAARAQPELYTTNHKQIMQLGMEVLLGDNSWRRNATRTTMLNEQEFRLS